MNPLGAYFFNQLTNFGKFTFEKRVVLRKRDGCTQAMSSIQSRLVNTSTAHDLAISLASLLLESQNVNG